MQVGRSHHWDYPDGVWVERKAAPDRWAVRFTAHKRRKGRGAPKGSGAPEGAEYHWFIVAHQRARKLDANTYVTDMVGAKHLVAFRQPGWQRWSSQLKGHKGQRQRLERIFREALAAMHADEGDPEGDALLPVPGMQDDPEWPPSIAPLPDLARERHGERRPAQRPRRDRRPARTHRATVHPAQARPARRSRSAKAVH